MVLYKTVGSVGVETGRWKKAGRDSKREGGTTHRTTAVAREQFLATTPLLIIVAKTVAFIRET
jgi:hypothetical protein